MLVIISFLNSYFYRLQQFMEPWIMFDLFCENSVEKKERTGDGENRSSRIWRAEHTKNVNTSVSFPENSFAVAVQSIHSIALTECM